MPIKTVAEIRKDVEALVAATETLKAIHYLQEQLPEGTGKRLQAVMLESKLGDVNRKSRTGQLKFDDEQVSIAQIRAAILDIAGSLNDADLNPATAGSQKPVSAVPKFVVLYNEPDKPHFDQLKKHLSILARFNKLRYYEVYGAEGEDLVARANTEIESADYLLVMITPNLFLMEPIDWFEVVQKALGQGRRMIPLRIENLGFPIPELAKLKSLPQGKWVSDFPSKDVAYAEIIKELSALLPK